MGITEILKITGIVLSMLLSVCYLYQVVYLFIPFFKKEKSLKGVKQHKFAFLIAARNEEEVLPHLLHSIRAQDYPPELLSVFVVADNCTDRTFDAAVEAGAIVYRRENKEQIGKGYALNFLLEKIDRDYGCDCFDGFFVFDADNLLEPDYVTKMNQCFGSGYEIVASYRNSKNFCDNWVSCGNALWFLHESIHLNRSRMLLGTSCAVSGTGFLFSRSVLKRQQGWNFFLLTEDIEFTTDNIIHGQKIGYCHSAVFYDEQPTSFVQSFRQRARWLKGGIQVYLKYGRRLSRGILTNKGNRFACFEMSSISLPGYGASAAVMFINFIIGALCYGDHGFLLILLGSFISSYFSMFAIGALTMFTQWKKIYAAPGKKIGYLFTFPLFMMTYVPVAVYALFGKIEWKPIKHSRAVSLSSVSRR